MNSYHFARRTEEARRFAEHLDLIEWQVFATLTFRYEVPSKKCLELWREFANAVVGRLYGESPVSVAFTEPHTDRDGYHLHVLLMLPRPVASADEKFTPRFCELVESRWEQRHGKAEVEPYDRRRDGTGYGSKKFTYFSDFDSTNAANSMLRRRKIEQERQARRERRKADRRDREDTTMDMNEPEDVLKEIGRRLQGQSLEDRYEARQEEAVKVDALAGDLYRQLRDRLDEVDPIHENALIPGTGEVAEFLFWSMWSHDRQVKTLTSRLRERLNRLVPYQRPEETPGGYERGTEIDDETYRRALYSLPSPSPWSTAA